MIGQHLDGDGAVEAGVSGLVDLAHAARAEGGVDLVGAEGGARGQRHDQGMGTRSVSSPSQLSTTMMSLDSGIASLVFHRLIIKNRWPSGEISQLRFSPSLYGSIENNRCGEPRWNVSPVSTGTTMAASGVR